MMLFLSHLQKVNYTENKGIIKKIYILTNYKQRDNKKKSHLLDLLNNYEK
jgi:hypothetical protein